MLGPANPVFVDQMLFSPANYRLTCLPKLKIFDLVQALNIVVVILFVPWHMTLVTLATHDAQQSTCHVLLFIQGIDDNFVR